VPTKFKATLFEAREILSGLKQSHFRRKRDRQMSIERRTKTPFCRLSGLKQKQGERCLLEIAPAGTSVYDVELSKVLF